MQREMGEMHNLKNGIYFQTSKHRFPINVHLENRFIKLTAAENKFPGVPLSFLFSKMNHYFRCFGLTIFPPQLCNFDLSLKLLVFQENCSETFLLWNEAANMVAWVWRSSQTTKVRCFVLYGTGESLDFSFQLRFSRPLRLILGVAEMNL